MRLGDVPPRRTQTTGVSHRPHLVEDAREMGVQVEAERHSAAVGSESQGERSESAYFFQHDGQQTGGARTACRRAVSGRRRAAEAPQASFLLS